METQNHYSPMKQEMTKEEFRVIWQSIHLKATDKYTIPPEIIRVNGSTIGTLGNFSASAGKAKSKKTFNVSAIVAAALTNTEVLCYAASFPADRRKVLYIDTEQSKYHCQKVMKRIFKLAGMPIDQECPNLLFVAMRELSPEKRRMTIDYMLSNIEGIGLVVIDGIGYNLHIHTVLHLNKGDDNTRGHIGTELNNKAETVLQVTKSQTAANISEVKAMHIRDKDFEPFAFRINEESLPELVVGYECQPKSERIALTDLSEEKHQAALAHAFKNGSIQGYDCLIAALKEGYASIGYERGRNTLVTHNKWLMSRGLIVKHDKMYSLPQGVYSENEHKPNIQTLFDNDH